MALYVDSAYLDDITDMAHAVPLAGVTTNPSILLAARERGQHLDPLSLLEELIRHLDGTIFMQPGIIEEEQMFTEALTYIEVAPERVIPKIPMTQTGLRVALRLKHERRRISFTAVTTVAQAYVAAMAQADFIIPYYNRLMRAGIDANERIAQMADVLRKQQLPTRILVASIKSPIEAVSALLSGAHDLTVSAQVLLEMVCDPLSEQAVEKFYQDWQRMKIP